MKYILFYILTVCIFLNAHSQFIYTKQGDKRNAFSAILEEENTQNLLVACNNYTWNIAANYYNSETSILKISPTGIMLDSIKIAGHFITYGKMLYYNNNYYIYGLALRSTVATNRMPLPTLIKFDANFNVVKTLVLDTLTTNYASVIQNTIILNNRMYLVYNYGLSIAKAKLFKLSLNLDVLDTATISADNLSTMIKQGNNLVIAGDITIGASPMGRVQAAKLDTNFNVVNRFNFDSITKSPNNCNVKVGIYSGYCNLVEISNSTYYAAGFYPVPYSGCTDDDQAVYAIIKNNSQVAVGKQYGATGGVKESYHNFASTSDRQGKYIYNICTSGMTDDIIMGTNYTPTSILIAKIDTIGNLVWQTYFNTPDYYYEGLAVATTADSGIVVSGMRYNILMPAFIDAFEGFIVKFDKYGNQVFTTLKENYQPFAELSLYPNPANTQTNLKFNNQDKENRAKVSVTNYLGQLVYQSDLFLTEGINTIEIDTKSYISGYYNISLTTKNGTITKKLSITE